MIEVELENPKSYGFRCTVGSVVITVLMVYSSIDEHGVHGFDSSVLETLIKFYLQEPTVSADDIDNKVSWRISFNVTDV